jgi:lactate dehydrogenase-like 2-hydroxyacid dehydrogenase
VLDAASAPQEWETMVERIELLQMGAYPQWDEERLNRRFTMHRYFEAADKAAFLGERAPGIRGIATRGELGASSDVIAALPNLEIISVYGVGFDAVHLPSARARGIRVTNTPDVLTKDVADFGVAMMLALARGIVGGEAWVRSGAWARQGNYPLRRRVYGKRAGILGLGRIGREVARRLAAFEMEIAYSDLAPFAAAPEWRYVEDPVALARDSDVLFVTLAASAETRHIVSTQMIEALGPDGMLVNISRASNIDEEALITALQTRKLGSAALDVFAGEPNIDPRFLALDNVLLEPHQASGTIETRRAMGDLVFDNLTAHFEGRDLPTPVI